MSAQVRKVHSKLCLLLLQTHFLCSFTLELHASTDWICCLGSYRKALAVIKSVLHGCHIQFTEKTLISQLSSETVIPLRHHLSKVINERHGRKAEILRSLWKNRVIFEASCPNCVILSMALKKSQFSQAKSFK